MDKIELVFDNLETIEGQQKTTFHIMTLQNKLYELIQNDTDFKITIEEI